MYCYHCGYEIHEKEVEAKSSTIEKNTALFKEGTGVAYVCPRCGHLIHHGEEEVDIKSLSRASHAEIQRGRNRFASGMGAVCLGAIGLALALLFLRLSFKPGQQNQLITNCPEFIVSMVLFPTSTAALIYGVLAAILGSFRVRKYELLLRDIHNETFVQ
jgi:hypothetical protein